MSVTVRDVMTAEVVAVRQAPQAEHTVQSPGPLF